MTFYISLTRFWVPGWSLFYVSVLSHPFFLYLKQNNIFLFFVIYWDVCCTASNSQGSFLYFFVICSVEQKLCLSFNFSFVLRTSPPLQCWSGQIISPFCTIHRFKVLFSTMLLQRANFLTHKKKEHQGSELEVCRGLKTIENDFLPQALALSC